eukprot:7772085-Ditylum_brightwellii.AAC.1
MHHHFFVQWGIYAPHRFPLTEILSAVRFVTRATVHTTMQATPMQLVFGRDAILNVVSKCFTESVDASLLPAEEPVKCVVIQPGIMCLSANQTQAVSLGTSYTTCNFSIGEEEGLHMLSID